MPPDGRHVLNNQGTDDYVLTIKQSQPVLGSIKNATISQVPSGKYFISFNVEIWVAKLPNTDKEIGLDLGIKELVITSDDVVS